jgi:hypothetical protein
LNTIFILIWIDRGDNFMWTRLFYIYFFFHTMTLSFVYTCDTVSFIMQYDVITYQKFNCCSAFQSHNLVFNNEQNSFPKMRVKQTIACIWVVLFTSADKWLHLGIFVILMLLCVYNLISQMWKMYVLTDLEIHF